MSNKTLSASDAAFQAKYGKAPNANAKAKAPAKGTRAELEALRQFKAQNNAQIAQATPSVAAKPLAKAPVTAPAHRSMSAYDKALAEARVSHNSVQSLRADVGLPVIGFDEALFKANFDRYQNQTPRADAATRAALLDKEMTSKVAGYKSTTQLAVDARSRSPEEQRKLLNAAILAEMQKM